MNITFILVIVQLGFMPEIIDHFPTVELCIAEGKEEIGRRNLFNKDRYEWVCLRRAKA